MLFIWRLPNLEMIAYYQSLVLDDTSAPEDPHLRSGTLLYEGAPLVINIAALVFSSNHQVCNPERVVQSWLCSFDLLIIQIWPLFINQGPPRVTHNSQDRDAAH